MTYQIILSYFLQCKSLAHDILRPAEPAAVSRIQVGIKGQVFKVLFQTQVNKYAPAGDVKKEGTDLKTEFCHLGKCKCKLDSGLRSRMECLLFSGPQMGH